MRKYEVTFVACAGMYCGTKRVKALDARDAVKRAGFDASEARRVVVLKTGEVVARELFS